MASFKPQDIALKKLHSFLLSAVSPRPIAFASTIDLDGKPNLSPFSFFNVFSANPPILIFSPARRVRDNSIKHSLQNVQSTKEVVVNIVSHSIVQQVSLSSSDYPKGVNEFEKAGFTMLKSDLVKPFRVAESPVQFECKVNDIIALGAEGGAGNLIICEVLKIHVHDTILNEDGAIDQEKLDVVARAGGNNYTRAKQGFFEIPKPLNNLGIGVDNIPEHIRNSKSLTGNDLGILGGIETLPTKEAIENFINNTETIKQLLTQGDTPAIHAKAQQYLLKGEVQSAWHLLLGIVKE